MSKQYAELNPDSTITIINYVESRSPENPDWVDLETNALPDEVYYCRHEGGNIVSKRTEIEAQDLIEKADIEIRFDNTLRAFALVVLDEINVIRQNAGLSPRTLTQLKDAVKAKL